MEIPFDRTSGDFIFSIIFLFKNYIYLSAKKAAAIIIVTHQNIIFLPLFFIFIIRLFKYFLYFNSW